MATTRVRCLGNALFEQGTRLFTVARLRVQVAVYSFVCVDDGQIVKVSPFWCA